MIQYNFLDNTEFSYPEFFIQQITGLYRSQRWWDGPDNEKHVIRIIKGSHCFVIAVLNFEEVVGMGRSISDGASDAYIQDVTVKKNYRGQAIGTRIVRMIINRLQKDGIFWIGLIAERGSHGFYEPIGFKQMPDSISMIFKP
ncbi:MAG: GNAT family N-acetyltransferase [Desulfobacterales bacterium]